MIKINNSTALNLIESLYHYDSDYRLKVEKWLDQNEYDIETEKKFKDTLESLTDTDVTTLLKLINPSNKNK